MLVFNILKKYCLIFFLLMLFILVFNFIFAVVYNWMCGYSGVYWVIVNLFVIVLIFCVKKLLEF